MADGRIGVDRGDPAGGEDPAGVDDAESELAAGRRGAGEGTAGDRRRLLGRLGWGLAVMVVTGAPPVGAAVGGAEGAAPGPPDPGILLAVGG